MTLCPFYLGKSMCGAKDSGLYVPPKEVEFKYCTGKFSKCKIYRVVEEGSATGNRCEKQNAAEGSSNREPRD